MVNNQSDLQSYGSCCTKVEPSLCAQQTAKAGSACLCCRWHMLLAGSCFAAACKDTLTVQGQHPCENMYIAIMYQSAQPCLTDFSTTRLYQCKTDIRQRDQAQQHKHVCNGNHWPSLILETTTSLRPQPSGYRDGYCASVL